MHLGSWSGGKDSCLACYRAIRNGIRISHLVHFAMEFNLHGVDPGLIREQAELTGIPIFQRTVLSDNFEIEFKDTVTGLIKNNIKGMIFGDIYLEPHKEWVERVCRELGIEALEPLWGVSTERLMNDFFDEGFEAIVVNGQERLIDKRWIGHKVDRNFMEYLKMEKLDVCGENGEYHTLVIAGPLFKGRIDLTAKDVINKNGHWFLDIKNYRVIR